MADSHFTRTTSDPSYVQRLATWVRSPSLPSADVVRLLRPKHWIKNAFVAAPLFFSPELLGFTNAMVVFAGIVCFCAGSSTIYILNDYIDRESDKLHPVKSDRPLASGAVDPSDAIAMMWALGVGTLLVAALLSLTFASVLAVYVAVNIAYSLHLKQIAIVDVMTISLGFVLRVFAGAILIGIAPSAWIIICTGLLALFLALSKRRDDLTSGLDVEHRPSLSGYTKPFLDTSIAVVLGAMLVSYLIYTTDETVMASMGSIRLYLTGPFVVAGILRYLQITLVEERSSSPTRIVLSDRFLQVCLAGWIATFAVLIYS